MEKISLKNAIVCEGKYDQIHLSSLFDAPILPLGGFQFQPDSETGRLLKEYAQLAPVIIAIDPDRAGFQLRRQVTELLGEDKVIQVYLPPTKGKEKRKTAPSKEGLLGVEGIPLEEIKEAFAKAGALGDSYHQPDNPLSYLHLYESGLQGKPGALEKRQAFLSFLKLPVHLNNRQLLLFCNRNGGVSFFQSAFSACFEDFES